MASCPPQQLHTANRASAASPQQLLLKPHLLLRQLLLTQELLPLQLIQKLRQHPLHRQPRLLALISN